MARRELLVAAALLVALRRDGCVVTAGGGIIRVTGEYSDTRRAAVIANKVELLVILAAEETALGAMDEPLADPTPPRSCCGLCCRHDTRAFPLASVAGSLINRGESV
jgi:hypothetical protein